MAIVRFASACIVGAGLGLSAITSSSAADMPVKAVPVATNWVLALDTVGFVTTGIQAKYTLESLIPKRLGTWYVKADVQYYHIVNDALLAAPGFNFATNSFPGAKQDIVLANGGFGFSF